MKDASIGNEFLKDIQAEIKATRTCLERIPADLFGWKPHEKSMEMGYLALLVAEIPRWISVIIEDSEIDLATFPHNPAKTTADLLTQLDEAIEHLESVLQKATDETFAQEFSLKANGKKLYSSSKKENVSSTIRHWVHHRGQLTVYMRLNNIAVPSIYGPSADDKSFG